MTAVSRGVPSSDAGTSLPYNDAVDFQNRLNADVTNLHDRAPVWLNWVSGNNNVVATAAITIPELREGMAFYYRHPNTNTGPMTFTIDGHGPVDAVTVSGEALANAEIKSGRLQVYVYDGTDLVVTDPTIGLDDTSGVPGLLLDAVTDTDNDYTSNDPYDEEYVENYTFTTTENNQQVEIAIYIPLVVFSNGTSAPRNGACRVYLDGTAFISYPGGAVQWNAGQPSDTSGGFLICNGGQWCTTQGVPVDTTVNSPSARFTIRDAGVHTIRVHIAGSTTDTVVSLHGRRRFQVKDVKAIRGEPGVIGPDGSSGTSALSIVRVVALANVAIATALENGDTLNGVTLVTGDFVLLTAQTAPAENGVYVVASSGAASRHTDFATYDSHCGRYFSVMEGTSKADTLWRCTSNKGGTLGTTALTITEFSGGGGAISCEVDVFTSGGTWTKRTNLVYVEVYTNGGGGGSRGSTGDGGNGGSSSFGSHCSATGGGGGKTSLFGTGGAGSGGDVNLSGGFGFFDGSVARLNQGGASPGLFGGPGSPGNAVNYGGGAGSGIAAQGGGGGGGHSYKKINAASLGSTETVTIGAGGTAGTGTNGLAGAPGIVVVKNYIQA